MKTIIGLVMIVLALGCISFQPSVSITSPTDGQIMKDHVITVNVDTSGITLVNPGELVNGQGYLKAVLDDSEQTGAVSSFTFAGLMSGPHTVTVELLKGDGSSFDPPVYDTAGFAIIPSESDVIKEFNITAESGKFNPSEITVNADDTVVLNIMAVDNIYGFSLGTYDIVEEIDQGQTKSISFLAHEPGEFNFFCGGFCDASYWDMHGKLIVKP